MARTSAIITAIPSSPAAMETADGVFLVTDDGIIIERLSRPCDHCLSTGTIHCPGLPYGEAECPHCEGSGFEAA